MSENDNEPVRLVVEVVQCRDADDEWLVEAIDYASDGEIYRAIFQGPGAKEKALAYAASAYGHNGIVMPQPSIRGRPCPKPKPRLTIVPQED